MKRILSLLLAAALTAVLLVSPAAASPAPWVQIDGRGTASQTVRLRGLSGGHNAVQLTLNLSRSPVQFNFDPSFSGADSHATYTQNGNVLTLYVVSKDLLNQGDSILLGTLVADQSFNVVSASSLKLLQLSTDELKDAAYNSVGVNTGGSTGGGNTGGGYYPPDYGNDWNGGGSTGGGNTSGGSTGGNTSGGNTGTAAIPFTDVKDGDWFREAVGYVYKAGLMNGTAPDRFDPYTTTTRGMIVTILHRYDGSPAAAMSSFQDVPAGQYYTNAVDWAAATGVVNGYAPGLFGPDLTITREQLAAILYRYAQSKGYDVSGRADLSGYADVGQVSSYAQEPIAWANYAGLINGVNEYTLQPGGYATRAQVATILMRFCENVAK